jgi:uncharacterized protein YjbJ (UPF0337 family)
MRAVSGTFGTLILHRSSLEERTMNKDQSTGHIKEAKGKIKEVVGNLVGNKDLENKGKIQNALGKAQATFGDAKADIKQAIQGK